MESDHQALNYLHQGLSSATPSTHSSPSSCGISEAGDDRSLTAMAIRTEPSNRRYSPYLIPSVQVTPPHFYSSINESGGGYALSHQRAHYISRRASYRSPSRLTSRSPTTSPALSPSPTLQKLAPHVRGDENGSPSTEQQHHPHGPSLLTQVTTASSSTLTLAPSVSFPSLSLPSHPALSVFQRVPQLQRQAVRLPQRTVERLIQPYRSETEHERPFGMLPKDVLDRVLRNVDYLTLIRARAVSRTCRNVIDPQLADREDKIGLVRDMENHPRNCRTRSYGSGSAGPGNGIPYRVGCYFCFTVKDATLFEAPGNQKHYAVVWIDEARNKARYEGLSNDDPRVPALNDNEFRCGIKQISTHRSSAIGETMRPGGSHGEPGQDPAQSQVWRSSNMQLGGHSLYNPQVADSESQQYYHHHHHHQHLQQHQIQQPQYISQNENQPKADSRAVVISLRRYCIECGVQNELYEPRSVFKDWTEKRKLWVCDCAKLPPLERIHNQEEEDFCAKCNVRASFR